MSDIEAVARKVLEVREAREGLREAQVECDRLKALLTEAGDEHKRRANTWGALHDELLQMAGDE